jgi:hypothetical protein
MNPASTENEGIQSVGWFRPTETMVLVTFSNVREISIAGLQPILYKIGCGNINESQFCNLGSF